MENPSAPGPPAAAPPSAFLPWALLLILALMWGTSFILIKRGLAIFPPYELGALRIVLAAGFLAPFAARAVRIIPRDRWKWLFIGGLIGNLLPAFLFSLAETRLASGLAGVLNSLTGLFTLLAGVLLFGQRLTALRVVGVVAGMAGTFLLLTSGAAGVGTVAANGTDGAYGLLIVLATAMYGLNLNIIRHKLAGVPPVEMAALALLSVAVPAAGYLLFTPVVAHTLAPGGGWAFGAVAMLAAGSTAVGLVLYNKLIHLKGTLFAASTVYLMPAVSLLWGLLDGERVYLGHYLGMAVILVGVTLVNRAR